MGKIYITKLMGLIYVTFPMSHSWEGFMSLLNGVNSPKVNLLKFRPLFVVNVFLVTSELT